MNPVAAELKGSATLRRPLKKREIDVLIARLSQVLSLRAIIETMAFRPQLEADFDAETAAARARELRLTMWIGLGCYASTAVMDPILVGDLQFRGVILRLLLLPLLVLAGVYVPGMPSVARERCLTAATIACTTSLALIAGASASAYAPYALGTVTLAAVFANTTHPLRFKYACLSTAVAGVAVVLAVHGYRNVDAGLALALDLQALIGSVFSLVATFRLERSARLTYLLELKARRRLDDVAAERELLSVLSQTDALTSLGNRVRLERWAKSALGDPASERLALGVLMIDVDFFKGYNDRYGHGAGDECLRSIAGVIAGIPNNAGDLAVRYGGEEFVVILTAIGALEVVEAARRIQSAVIGLQLPHPNRTDRLALVTVSIGVACTILQPGWRFRDVMDAADGALYAAKRNGRNRIEVAHEPALLAAC